MIKITDGRRKTKKYRKVLRRLGLTFSPTSKYTGFWYTHDDSRFKELSWFCKRYKLNIQMLDENDTRYSRSSTYRQDFFTYNKGYKGNGRDYHCAYCGRHLKKDQVEVDHVISIKAVQTSSRARKMLEDMGIDNVNDPRNLVAACKSCNRQKSSKQGAWVTMGFRGSDYRYWQKRKKNRKTIVNLIAFFIYFTFFFYYIMGDCTLSEFLVVLLFTLPPLLAFNLRYGKE